MTPLYLFDIISTDIIHAAFIGLPLGVMAWISVNTSYLVYKKVKAKN